MNQPQPIALPTPLSELLAALHAWLAARQAGSRPEHWLALCHEASRCLAAVEALLAQGQFRAAESELRELFARLGAQELTWRSDRGEAMGSPSTSPLGGAGLLQSLRRMLGMQPAPDPITTYALLHAPAQVTARTTFFIDLTAHPRPAPQSTSPLNLQRERDTSVDLEVEMKPEPGLLARGATTAVLRVQPDGHAATLRFELFAPQEGSHCLTVSLRYDGAERARSTHRVTVVPIQEQAAGEPTCGPAAVPLSVEIGRAFSGLVLRVRARERSATARTFHLLLSGPQWIGAPSEGLIELPADAQKVIAELCRDLPRVAELSDAYSRMSRLRNLGAALTRKALPPQIAQSLGRYPEGTPLHIESEDAWVPWEALWLADDRSGGAFLGERYAVTRWLHVGNQREQAGGPAVVLVAPSYSHQPLNSETERRVLRELTGTAPVELRRLGELLACLKGQPRCNVLHFAGHGSSMANQSFGESLSLEDDALHPIDIVPPAPGERGPLDAVLVFLNACQAGIEQREQPGLWDFSGWASAFLRGGAGALVAPSWTVTDLGAAAFAESFYRHAAAGLPLGEAARRARLASPRSDGHDRLGYAIYCAPTTTLAQSAVVST